jgi:restriction endonuclease
VMLITDGDFSPEAHSFAADHPLILVDGAGLLEMVCELMLGDARERKLGTRLVRLIRGQQGRPTKPN